MIMKKYLLIAAAFLISGISFGQTNPDSIKVKKSELAKGLYLFNMYGCNLIVMSGADGVLLVDACYAELAGRLKKEVAAIDSTPVKYIINTHWHFDHIGANRLFSKEGIIIAHDTTRTLLSQDQILLGDTIEAEPAEGLPQLTFSKDMNLYFNSDTIRLIAMSGGHTGSDIVVYFKKEKVLHIGDIIFAEMFPFCDVDHGGNVLKMSEVVQRIISSFPADTRIIAGHGKEYSMDDMKKYKEMIVSTYKLVLAEINKNKTLEEIKKADVLKDWKEWGVAFSCDDWTELIYMSVKGKNEK
jgi:cyclase